MDALGCKFITIMGVMAFNNNVAPILATMAVDISCFESLFAGAAPLSSTYAVEYCSLLFTGTGTTEGSGTDSVICDLFDTVASTIHFEPPFIYSNQVCVVAGACICIVFAYLCSVSTIVVLVCAAD